MLLTALCKGRPLHGLLTKTLRVMKLTAVILLAFGIQVFAKGNAQTVSFSGRNISLEKVFSVIERQTNFVVFYEDALLKLTTPVTLNLRNSSLEGFLNEALKNQPLEYSIKGETVFISRKKPFLSAVSR